MLRPTRPASVSTLWLSQGNSPVRSISAARSVNLSSNSRRHSLRNSFWSSLSVNASLMCRYLLGASAATVDGSSPEAREACTLGGAARSFYESRPGAWPGRLAASGEERRRTDGHDRAAGTRPAPGRGGAAGAVEPAGADPVQPAPPRALLRLRGPRRGGPGRPRLVRARVALGTRGRAGPARRPPRRGPRRAGDPHPPGPLRARRAGARGVGGVDRAPPGPRGPEPRPLRGRGRAAGADRRLAADRRGAGGRGRGAAGGEHADAPLRRRGPAGRAAGARRPPRGARLGAGRGAHAGAHPRPPLLPRGAHRGAAHRRPRASAHQPERLVPPAVDRGPARRLPRLPQAAAGLCRRRGPAGARVALRRPRRPRRRARRPPRGAPCRDVRGGRGRGGHRLGGRRAAALVAAVGGAGRMAAPRRPRRGPGAPDRAGAPRERQPLRGRARALAGGRPRRLTASVTWPGPPRAAPATWPSSAGSRA